MINDSLRSTRILEAPLLILLLVPVLVSCYSAARVYDEFPTKSAPIETVVLVHEAQISNDIQGARDFIHIQENIRCLSWIHDAVERIVGRKGYEVSDRSLWSIGYLEKPGTPVLVYTDGEEEWPGFFADEPNLTAGAKTVMNWLPDVAFNRILGFSVSDGLDSAVLGINLAIAIAAIALVYLIVIWQIRRSDRL